MLNVRAHGILGVFIQLFFSNPNVAEKELFKNMGAGGVHGFLFRPPNPCTYTHETLEPTLVFKRTSRGSNIPIAVHMPPGYRNRRYITIDEDYWILFSHGNAEDLGNVGIWGGILSEVLDMVVVTYDYTGYGMSNSLDGNIHIYPSEENVYSDVEAVLEFAEALLGYSRKQAILWGRSLGSSPTAYIASKCKKEGQPVAGVVLQSPFTSVLGVAFNSHVQKLSENDVFRNYDRIRESEGFDAPCFVIHGENDWIVNCWHGKEIARIIPERFRWPPLFNDCGHNDLESKDPDEFIREISGFIDFCKLVGEET